MTFYQRAGEKVQSMKEKWLGFATDENVDERLEDTYSRQKEITCRQSDGDQGHTGGVQYAGGYL